MLCYTKLFSALLILFPAMSVKTCAPRIGSTKFRVKMRPFLHLNKAGYTALSASKHLHKRRRYEPKDRPIEERTDERTHGRTDPLIQVLHST